MGRSSIAGGVAMGSVANLVAKPWEATFIGAVGAPRMCCGTVRRTWRARSRSRVDIICGGVADEENAPTLHAAEVSVSALATRLWASVGLCQAARRLMAAVM